MSLSFNNVKIAIDVAIHAGHVPSIVGLQGIGKSDLVREYAKERGYAFSEITCSLVQEGDLAMPFISGKQEVSYAINKIITELCEKAKDTEYAILFLDEFNRPSSQVQSELMNLVLQREIVGYHLRDNVRIVLAMNPSAEMEGYGDTDYSVSYSDSAILGRIISLNMEPSLVEWLEYGKKHSGTGREVVHPVVRNYLSKYVKEFTTKESQGHVNNTPRGWSRVSDLLYTYEEMGVNSFIILKNLISGTIERGSADRFVSFYKENRNAIDYLELASSTLNALSPDDWSNTLLQLNDAGLDKVFNLMCELVKEGKVSSNQLENLSTFILSVQKELSYSWVSLLQRKYEALYISLVENNDFALYVQSILINMKSTEVGGFSGK